MAKPKTSKVAKKPAAKKPAAKKPAAKKKAAKKPAAKKPAAKKKAVKKPAAKKPAAAKAAPPSARARGVTVEAYVAALPPAFRSIADKLVALVREVAPEAKVSIKWGQPVFELGGPVLWMKAHAKHFGLGFWRGAELPDPKRLLEGAGQRMRHIKLRDPNAIDEPGVRALIRAAAEANEAKGDPTRRR